MVINLGFGEDATNTTDGSQWNAVKIEKMEFPLKHPEYIMRDKAIDGEVFLKYSTTAFVAAQAQDTVFHSAVVLQFF